jgi:DNA repair exonuclease SbcCD ATPase subunit
MSNENTQLVAINNERIQLALVDAKARQSLLAEVREHIDKFEPDTTTVTGRKAIASITYKVAQTKTTIDAVGKDLVADAKAKIKVVDEARKEIRDTLDGLRDSVREPLTKYEQRIEDEKRIIAGWEATKDLTDIQTIMETLEMFCGEMHKNTIEFMDVSLHPYAEQVKAAAIATLQSNLAKAKEAEAEAKRIEEERAELDRLRKADADRKLKEEREELERKAAERATAEAAVAAQRAIENANRKAQEAEQRAAQAEAQAKARAESERQQQAAQEAKRAADQIHRNNIMRAAYMDIRRMIQDAPQDPSKQAEMVVREIAAGNVANVKMEW